MIKWKDTTSYSRGDKECKPAYWTAKIGKLRIDVVYHIYYPGKWVVHCEPFYDTFLLKAGTAEEAKEEALSLIRVELDIIEDLLAR